MSLLHSLVPLNYMSSLIGYFILNEIPQSMTIHMHYRQMIQSGQFHSWLQLQFRWVYLTETSFERWSACWYNDYGFKQFRETSTDLLFNYSSWKPVTLLTHLDIRFIITNAFSYSASIFNGGSMDQWNVRIFL